jgi:glycosyltransferase involved in cell wall biosynthesis
MLLPSISVIVPTYNRAKTIRYCLDSVLAQTFKPLEIIVVDDCSTDETAAEVNSYSNPGVRYIVLGKNSGAQAARNCGIREAKGDWIAFQDSDDEWLPDKLEKQVHALAEVGFDLWTVVHTNAIWLDISTGRRLPIELPVVEGDNVYPLLLNRPAPMFQGMLVSRQAIEKIGLLDEKVPSYQEWDASICLAKYCRFIYLKETLFIYYMHGETMSNDMKRDIHGYQYIIDKYKNEIIKHCGSEALGNHYCCIAMKYLVLKDYSKANEFIKMAKKYGVSGFKFKSFISVAAVKPTLARRFIQFYITKIKKVNRLL